MSRRLFSFDANGMMRCALVSFAIIAVAPAVFAKGSEDQIDSYKAAVNESATAFSQGDYAGARRHLVRAGPRRRDTVGRHSVRDGATRLRS